MSVFALVHIGSAGVSAGLLSEKKFIFATERECRFSEKLDSREFLQTISEALKLALQDLLTAKRSSPSKVVIFLSSPFVAGQLNLLQKVNQEAFRVTEKLVWDLISQDKDKFKSDKQHTVVDSKIMSFRLAGYPVLAPHGQKTDNLEIAHYLSIGATEVLEQFRGVARAVLHHEELEFHSASFANYYTTHTLWPKDENFLLLDLGGEITELSIIWQGIIRETFSYPLGHHAVLRELVHKTKTPAIEAESALSASLVDEKKLIKIKTEWLAQLEAGLGKILQHRFWSGEIILIAENETFSNLFTSWLKSAKLENVIFSQKQLVINQLKPELLKSFITVEPEVKPSLPLLVESVFVLK